jgi:hypothetical protein
MSRGFAWHTRGRDTLDDVVRRSTDTSPMGRLLHGPLTVPGTGLFANPPDLYIGKARLYIARIARRQVLDPPAMKICDRYNLVLAG